MEYPFLKAFVLKVSASFEAANAKSLASVLIFSLVFLPPTDVFHAQQSFTPFLMSRISLNAKSSAQVSNGCFPTAFTSPLISIMTLKVSTLPNNNTMT